MSRIIYQFMALCAIAVCLGGCPLLNPLLAAPESAFEASPTAGEAPLTVLFVDASEAGTTNITEWQWDFGDGSTSTTRNPSHIYETPGLYTVSLTVTTSVGTETALKRDYINVEQLPMAAFSAAPVLGNAPLTVEFGDTSDPGSSEIIDWQWNFGDRTPTSAEQNPIHLYDEAGLYTVSLTVTTAVGSDTVEKVQYINVAGNPVADFTTDFAPGTAPLTVAFTDASDAGTAAITGWMWDFGDEGTSTDQNPSHTYILPGLYTVSLTIVSEVGEDTVVRENLIAVEEGPTAVFSGDPVMGAAPLSVIFTDDSAAGSMVISKWLWDFGDGGLLSTLQNPTRVYDVPGLYTVWLRVTTSVGSHTLEQPEYITVLPGVSFSATQTTGAGTVTTQFIDQSPTGDFEITAWAWDFGDGMMSEERNPEHTYAEPGLYDVSLTISTSLGDSTATEAGFIVVAPATAFSAAPTSGPPPLDVAFADETAAGSFEITAWAWDFGDGNASEEQSPAHTYAAPGIYSVSLQTTTENGTTTEEKAALIQVDPVVAIGADSTSGQGTLTVNFDDQTETGNLTILSWFWDFGDGMTGTEQNPSHSYQGIGTYTVSLRVTTALGDTTATETDLIKV
ncbi:MAG: PKD domain-containing protein, partial [Candidatus Hydrogenedentes bacterium]|nr:PKD domain-containing protein [Candidatus Hydrogenedentota bacterium]